VAIALAAAAWIVGGRHTDTPAPFAQFEVELKSDGVLASNVGTAVVVSRTGRVWCSFRGLPMDART
jgi:hypothetical protein